MHAVLVLLLACAGKHSPGGDDTGPTTPEPPGEVVGSSAARDTDPDVDEATVQAHAASMRAFGLDLLRVTAGEENLFSSPYSVSIALAMTYAGANGDTERQMADALRFDLPEDQLHAAFNAIDLTLDGRPDEVRDTGGDPGEPFRLAVVNQLFGQVGFGFEAPFLDVLAVNYDADMRLLDFSADPEGSRTAINAWVEEVTENRIVDLLPKGSIIDLTRLVLVNAIYFKASWFLPFEESLTTDDAFTTLSGAVETVPTMHGEQETLYGRGEGYALVDLPYVGQDLVMTLIVPDAGRFTEVRDGLDPTVLDAAVEDMGTMMVTLALPRLSIRSQFVLADALKELGMVDAFDPALADLTGMSADADLYVGGVYHQAFVAVSEAGTEAAAATAVVINDESEPERVTLTVDRPFLFTIRDRPTGTVLFLGQVVDPG